MRKHSRLCLLCFTVHLILILGIEISMAEQFLLPERINFNPGTIYELENMVTKLSIRDGSVILDQEHPRLSALVPVIQGNVTCALICRSCSIKKDTFNLIKVMVNGKWIGNYYPCTETFTNKKLLFSGMGSNVEITMELEQGPGCLVDNLRIYPADEAYGIKKLAFGESQFADSAEYFHPDGLFRQRALTSAKWLDGSADEMHSLRLLVKRTANWGKDSETFKMMIRRYIEYLETPHIQSKHELANTAFEMYYPLNKWDEIEDDKKYGFSKAWRLEIINTLYYMARISFIDWCAYRLNRHYREYRYVFPDEWGKLGVYNHAYQFRRENEVLPVIGRCKEFDDRHPFVPHNHMTQPALSLLYAAKYFERYKIPEVKVWYDVSSWTFAPLMNSFKPMEDCYMYQYWAMNIAAKYALLDGKEQFFERGGSLWRYIDLEIASTNNKGDGVSYGDVTKYGRLTTRFDKSKDVFNCLTVDSRLLMPTAFRNVIKDKKPADYVGLYVHPLDNIFYKYYADLRGWPGIPQEQYFDKISFRGGWNRDDQYLLLDGVSVGYHGHQDGNAILEFSEKNRMWLLDMGYSPKGIRRAASHNMVTISRPEINNGEESPKEKTPPFATILYKADLISTTFTSTILRDYNGTDWTRSIIWKKGLYFAVLDKVVNIKKAPCIAICRWRTLGETNLKGNSLIVTQSPKKGVAVEDKRDLSFQILHLDCSKARIKDGMDQPSHWADYPYAGPIVRILEETWQFEENSSNQHVFTNLFFVADKGNEGVISGSHIDRTSVKVCSHGVVEIVGTDVMETKEGSKTDAALFLIGKSRVALCNATFLFLNGSKVLESSEPVSIEFDFDTNQGKLVAQKTTLLKLHTREGWRQVEVDPGEKYINLGTAAMYPPKHFKVRTNEK